MQVSLLAVVLLVVVTACGGSAKKSASPTTTAATTTKQSTSTSKVSSSFGSTKNCSELMALGAKMAQAMQPMSGNAQTGIADEAKALQAMAGAAPAEIRGDFETFASAFTAYAQAFEKAGLKVGKTPTAAQLVHMATAAKAFSAPKLQAAEQHLSAWAQKNCGGASTTTTTG
ncbi:MAG TPA: hypothetical protein VJ375_04180 [Gaiellaceae bacterium]|nr:hypothetical protein [Gaiellaceae bacterium]